MCAGMIDLKKAMTRITDLEEELKATREDYEEEIIVLVEKNDDLTRKLGVFMEDPASGGEDDEPREIRGKSIDPGCAPCCRRWAPSLWKNTAVGCPP